MLTHKRTLHGRHGAGTKLQVHTQENVPVGQFCVLSVPLSTRRTFVFVNTYNKYVLMYISLTSQRNLLTGLANNFLREHYVSPTRGTPEILTEKFHNDLWRWLSLEIRTVSVISWKTFKPNSDQSEEVALLQIVKFLIKYGNLEKWKWIGLFFFFILSKIFVIM